MAVPESRPTSRRVLDALASRTVSFWVMGAWIALALVWLVPFQLTGQPESTVVSIASAWLPFKIAHAGLVLTTAVCAALRLQRDLRRAGRALPMERALPAEPQMHANGTLDGARGVLEEMGFDVESGADRVLGRRYGWSLLGGSVFHLAIVLLAAGLVVHAATYGAIGFRLIEGQGGERASVTVKRGEGQWAGMPGMVRGLVLKRIQPAFHKDVLLFYRLDAAFTEKGTGRQRDMSLPSPLWIDPFTFLSLQDFGYAPRVQLVDAKGKVVEDIVDDIAVFPPGGEDSLRLPTNGYTVSMMVYPDYGVVRGRDVSLSYNLRNPRIVANVEQDFPVGMTRVRRLVKLGEAIPGTDRLVRIKEILYYGQFRLQRSYAWPFLAISAVLMLAGLSARLVWPCTDVVVWESGPGLGMTARVDGRTGSVGAAKLLTALAGEMAGSGTGGKTAEGGDGP